jgi:3-isopropylmalate dehydratase small subunit
MADSKTIIPARCLQLIQRAEYELRLAHDYAALTLPESELARIKRVRHAVVMLARDLKTQASTRGQGD